MSEHFSRLGGYGRARARGEMLSFFSLFIFNVVTSLDVPNAREIERLGASVWRRQPPGGHLQARIKLDTSNLIA